MKKLILIFMPFVCANIYAQSELDLPYSIKIVNPKNLDWKRGNWPSTTSAKSNIPISIRTRGLTVFINSCNCEYWWPSDTTDTGLVVKGSGAAGSDTYIQRNIGGNFGATSSLFYDETNNIFNASKNLSIVGTGTRNNNFYLGTDYIDSTATGTANRWNFFLGEEHRFNNQGNSGSRLHDNFLAFGDLNIMRVSSGAVGNFFSTGAIGGTGNTITVKNGGATGYISLGGQNTHFSINGISNRGGFTLGGYDTYNVGSGQAGTAGMHTYTSGISAFTHGMVTDYNGDQSYSTTAPRTLASGKHSFNWSANSTSGSVGIGAVGDFSAILGGVNGNVTGKNSLVLGGYKLSVTDSATVAIPYLQLGYKPIVNDTLANILVYDYATGKVRRRHASSISGGGGGSGTVNSGTANQLAYYPSTGPAVSGSNVKTVNGNSILGTGDISTSGPIGDLYSEDFSGGTLINYTNTGSATAAISGGTLNISGGSVGATSNVISRNIKSSFDVIYHKVRFSPTANVTGEAIGIGLVSVNSAISMTMYATFNTSASTNRGQVKIHSISSNAGTDVTVGTSPSSLTYTNGDVLEMTFIYSGPGTTEVHVKNVTTPANANVYCIFTSTNVPGTTPTGYAAVHAPAIYPLGGTFSVSVDVFGTTQKSYPTVLRIGDSITAGAFDGSNNVRETDIIGSQVYGGSVLYASGGNTTLDVLNAISYVTTSIKPRYAAIWLGINDIARGVSLGTTTTSGTYLYNMQQIIKTLIANNIIPIILTISPTSNSVGLNSTVNTWNAALVTNFGSQFTILDYNAQLVSGGVLNSIYDAGDGLHLNALAHSVLGNYFVSQTSFIRATKQFGLYSNLDYNGSRILFGNGTNNISISTGFAGYTSVLGAPIISGNGAGSGGLNILPSQSGTSGNTLRLSYFNQSAYKSALEFSEVGSGNSTLYLMKDGGTTSTGPITSSGTGHFDGNFTVGTTGLFSIVPDITSFGELVSGCLFEGSNSGGLNVVPDAAGTAGNKTVFAYWDGSNYKSAFEYGNVSSGFSTLKLLRNGGNVQVGNLAGTGERTVLADASGNLKAVVGTKTDLYSTSTTITIANHTVRGNATGGNITFTLPSAASTYSNGYGQEFIFKKTDSSINTVIISSSDTIDGSTTQTISFQNQIMRVQSNGTSYDMTSN